MSADSVCHRIEDAFNRVVLCRDGSKRKLIAFDHLFLTYAVEISPGVFVPLTPTRRHLIEQDFLGAEMEPHA